MIKHIVLWKLKNLEDAQTMKTKLEALPEKIKEIQSLEVGLNIIPIPGYDIVLTVTFNNLEDLNTYQYHPEHLKVVDFIKAVTSARVAIDYKV